MSHRLQLGEAIALSFLAAAGCRDEAAYACDAQIKNGALWIDRVIDRYWSYLGGNRSISLDFSWLNEIDFDVLTTSNVRRRSTAPKRLIWLVTLACNRRCPYCYYDVIPHDVKDEDTPPDATFSRSAIFRMFAEMADIGSSHLYLTGGEPLLRRDIIDIIAEAARYRVRTHLSTKYPIDQALANRLRDAEVYSITYSLDAGSRRIADGLAGSKGFFHEAVRSLRALTKAGLAPEVNAVLSRTNMYRFDDLVRVLIDCGVRRLSISPFVSPITKQCSIQALTTAPNDAAPISMVHHLRDRWADAIEIRLGDSGQNLSASADPTRPVCDVGFSDLHVLPNGSVTRCRYLPAEKTLQLGSLEQLCIMDVWQSESLEALNSPTRSKYEGTACAACGLFEKCNERGRCYASALKTAKTLVAPDGFCCMRSI